MSCLNVTQLQEVTADDPPVLLEYRLVFQTAADFALKYN